MAKKKISKLKEKTVEPGKFIVFRTRMRTGISTRVFDSVTGAFLYSSWVNKNLKLSNGK